MDFNAEEMARATKKDAQRKKRQEARKGEGGGSTYKRKPLTGESLKHEKIRNRFSRKTWNMKNEIDTNGAIESYVRRVLHGEAGKEYRKILWRRAKEEVKEERRKRREEKKNNNAFSFISDDSHSLASHEGETEVKRSKTNNAKSGNKDSRKRDFVPNWNYEEEGYLTLSNADAKHLPYMYTKANAKKMNAAEAKANKKARKC